MNIFVLDEDIKKCAIYHVDRHIVKMPLESAQMLCTAINIYGGVSPYKTAHLNHPCSIWVRESRSNFIWLCNLGLALCHEYTFRYGKVHSCESVIKFCMNNIPEQLEDKGLTKFAEAMDSIYKLENPLLSYRNYYKQGKTHLHSWKKREKPTFIE
jgi:hypothetical protein